MLLEPASLDGGTRVAIRGVTSQSLSAVLDRLHARERAYAKSCAFKAEPGQCLLLPGEDGSIASVLFGVEPDDAPSAKPGRPEGGEVQTAHGLFELIAERYAGSRA